MTPLFYVRHDGTRAEGCQKVGNTLTVVPLTRSHLLSLLHQVTEALVAEERREAKKPPRF
ncbi:MAG: hypothetical protein AB7P12_09715 [Alphaproteobacteria bacterium]